MTKTTRTVAGWVIFNVLFFGGLCAWRAHQVGWRADARLLLFAALGVGSIVLGGWLVTLLRPDAEPD